MKRALFLVGIFLIILGFSSFLYYRYVSVSFVLKDEKFSEKDILLKQEHSVLEGETGTLFLLANSERIGLIYSKSNKWGIREKGVVSSVADLPSAEQIITVGFARETEEFGRLEKHIIVAYYLANDKKLDVGSPADFDLTVDYFSVNNQILLVAHAVSTNRGSLGSDDVIAYLESYYPK
ncbi:hypothetical protein [Sporosarcina sp. Te-1]|uniref:hypothetical protein n=1 Tax=Sporosarcina sp. Te-1 TaxID=2818390 RepID=UPI001A9D5C22|nr:hypothetical protein [Sporosarcina sp. Te-1]QTD43229.1 hypothetical protein J3U78_11020 [Sporosarcina sp. Te-1]